MGATAWKPLSHVAPEIGAVDLGGASFTANAQRPRAGTLASAVWVPGRMQFVLHVQVAAESEHALALHLAAGSPSGRS
jgi:hypothetical protein